jgi:hypothetical protein
MWTRINCHDHQTPSFDAANAAAQQTEINANVIVGVKRLPFDGMRFIFLLRSVFVA